MILCWEAMVPYDLYLLKFMLGIKLEGTNIENSMKQRAKQAGDYFFGNQKIHLASKTRDIVAQRAS